MRLGAVSLVGALCASFVACGAPGTDVRSGGPTSVTSEAATSSSTSTTGTPTSTPAVHDGGPLPADLPACTGQTTYSTESDWVLAHPPAGYQVVTASTYVSTDVAGDAPDRGESWLFARTSPDRRVLATFSLNRGGEPTSGESMYDSRDDGNGVQGLRGTDGAVFHVINRGDSLGWSEAEWTEGGVRWRALSRMSEEDLATTLNGLDLAANMPRDRSGSFELVGYVPSGPALSTLRTTSIELRPTDNSARPESLFVRIDQRPQGAFGVDPEFATGSASASSAVGETSAQGEAVLEEASTGKRLITIAGPDAADARRGLSQRQAEAYGDLPDGSSLNVRWLDEPVPRDDPPGAEVQRTLLTEVAEALVPATYRDPRLVDVALAEATSGTEVICMEPT